VKVAAAQYLQLFIYAANNYINTKSFLVLYAKFVITVFVIFVLCDDVYYFLVLLMPLGRLQEGHRNCKQFKQFQKVHLFKT